MMILLLAVFGTTTAQQPQQGNMPGRNYFQQTVLPFLQQQQAKFEQSLTNSEKAALQKIRKEMADFRKQGAQMREAMQGHFNQQAWDARKAQFEAIVAKARKIADAHPAASAAYKKAMENELARWRQRMAGMSGNGRMQGRGQGMMGKSPHGRMEKLSDPAFGLLFNAEAMQKMLGHHRRGMGKFGAKAVQWGHRPMMGQMKPGRDKGMAREIMMALHNPRVRAKIKAYKENHILPVVSKQRKAFDQVLSKKEKKAIASARAGMKAQREKMMQMRKEGVRPSDSARLAMQQQIDKDRMAIRGIVLKHYGELQKTLAPIKEKMPQWRKDIRKIVAEYVVEQQMQHMSKTFGKKIQPFLKEKGEMMFLLMDPAHPESNEMFRFMGHQKK